MRDFHRPGRSAVYASGAMCATSHPLAAEIATRIMADGGNAVDGAIAAAAVLGQCEPAMTGLGGDMFALVKPAGEDRIVGLNASGRAPAALSAAMLRDAGAAKISIDSPHAVTIPGAVDGLCRLSEDWGRLSLAETLAPAIRYADAGIPVAPRVAFDWRQSFNRLQDSALPFYANDGAPYETGQMFRAPALADVMRRIADEGRAGFYEGEVMEDMVASLRAFGGVHEAADFAATKCDYVEPVSASYKGLDLVELPPNGQGVTALLILKILSHFDLAAMAPFGAERAHIEAEATKLAYEARNRYVADPDSALTARMLDDALAARLAALIDPDRAAPTPPPAAGTAHRDTVYLTTADSDGMMVSMIYSVFKSFGSGIASSRFGILFQNRGAGFTLEEGHPNELAGGKRPLHTIIPAMIRRDGRVEAAYGVMGGQYQSTGHARVLTNMVDFGMDPQAAIDAPRCFADPEDGKLHIERGYGEDVRAALEAKGHVLKDPDTPIGGAQMIRVLENGVYEGASDPRKDGCALGW